MFYVKKSNPPTLHSCRARGGCLVFLSGFLWWSFVMFLFWLVGLFVSLFRISFFLTSITRFVEVIYPKKVTVKQPSTKQIKALYSILSMTSPATFSCCLFSLMLVDIWGNIEYSYGICSAYSIHREPTSFVPTLSMLSLTASFWTSSLSVGSVSSQGKKLWIMGLQWL